MGGRVPVDDAQFLEYANFDPLGSYYVAVKDRMLYFNVSDHVCSVLCVLFFCAWVYVCIYVCACVRVCTCVWTGMCVCVDRVRE